MSCNKKVLKIGKVSLLVLMGLYQTSAYCEGNVDIYGRINAALNYHTDPRATGTSRLDAGEGPITGSRIGFKGQELISSDLRTLFILEEGFNVGNGQLAQGGRAFGRQAFAGLSSKTWGTLTLGRQITLGAEMVGYTDIFGTANSNELAGTQLFLTGLRWDKSVKYSYEKNNFRISTMGAIANNLNSSKQNISSPAYGLMTSYVTNPLEIYGFYQDVKSSQDGTPGTKPGVNLNMYGIGSNYQFNHFKSLISYYQSYFSLIHQTNKTVTLGGIYDISTNTKLKGVAVFENQENAFGQNGTRKTYSLMDSYCFSKKTEVYIESDYTRVDKNYTNIVFPFNNSKDFTRYHLNASVGMIYRF